MTAVTFPERTRSTPLPVLAPRLTAAALLLGPLGIAVSDACYAIATRNGGSDETTAGELALATDHPMLYRASSVAAILACLFLVPAALAAAQLAAQRAPRLAALGGWLMAAGYICYVGLVFTGFTTLAVAEGGTGLDAFASAKDAVTSDPSALWVFLLFVFGNMAGTLLLGIALIRSRSIPRWAGVLVAAWPAFHITGLALGVEWFEVTGAVLVGVGFAQVARRLIALHGEHREVAGA